ncbi:FCD domain protein, partial [Bordetella pertussis STO1-SEAT-0006]|uniref:GntR family transcriptional regulator n=1 Tax=Bordetella pertussis TaxID=520 RepID=UPI0003D3BB8F
MAISGPSTYPLDAGHSAPSLKIGEQHMPLFAVIRDKLRERILSGEFTPGDRLIEGRLSDDMGVSRIPVREALRALAAEGLVTIEPRRGASVAVPSEAIAYDMVEVRATLEGLNAKLAAQRRDDATVTRLRKFLDDGTEAARSDDLQQFLALNSQFHEMLATIAGNVVLTDLMRSLRDRILGRVAAIDVVNPDTQETAIAAGTLLDEDLV